MKLSVKTIVIVISVGSAFVFLFIGFLSLRPVYQIVHHTFGPPIDLSFSNYASAWLYPDLIGSFFRSLIIGFTVTAISLILAILPAYVIARYQFWGRPMLQKFLLVGAYGLSPSLLIVPYYGFLPGTKLIP